jgi:hypothetical protein
MIELSYQRLRSLIGAVALMSLPAGAFALDSIVQAVAEGCKTEIESYCSKVTPGEGRVVACLLAHQDKLSGRCDYVLYEGAAQLDRLLTAITYVASECRDDILKHCAKIPVGEGRVAQCLKKNDAQLAKRCKDAIKDTKMEVK